MIDGKKIEEGLNQYVDDDIIYDFGLFSKGFKAGINWYLDNLWRPMSETPEIGREILIKLNMKAFEGDLVDRDSVFVHEYDYHDNWEFYANNARYLQWLYIDDLLTKKKEVSND